jgi:hypothetical protein
MGVDPLKLRLLLLNAVGLVSLVALPVSQRSFASELPWVIPAWLRAHIGEGEGQIAQVVLQRARALYLHKARLKIPATSPWTRRAPPGWGVGFT